MQIETLDSTPLRLSQHCAEYEFWGSQVKWNQDRVPIRIAFPFMQMSLQQGEFCASRSCFMLQKGRIETWGSKDTADPC